MNTFRTPSSLLSFRRAFAAAVALGLAASLSGCYVVPVDPRVGPPPAAQVPPAAPVVVTPRAPVTFPVRLYPANQLASRFGVINAAVTNDAQGHGTFTAAINGESFVGEATRKAGSSREGVASGAGNRGGFLQCAYTMNTLSQGTGQCRLSDGALFDMHMGN